MIIWTGDNQLIIICMNTAEFQVLLDASHTRCSIVCLVPWARKAHKHTPTEVRHEVMIEETVMIIFSYTRMNAAEFQVLLDVSHTSCSIVCLVPWARKAHKHIAWVHGVAVHPRVNIPSTWVAGGILDLILPVKLQSIIEEVELVGTGGMIPRANCPIIVDRAVRKVGALLATLALLPLPLVALLVMVGAERVTSVVARAVFPRVAEHDVAVLVVTNKLVTALCPHQRTFPGSAQATLWQRRVVVFRRSTEALVDGPVTPLAVFRAIENHLATAAVQKTALVWELTPSTVLTLTHCCMLLRKGHLQLLSLSSVSTTCVMTSYYVCLTIDNRRGMGGVFIKT